MVVVCLFWESKKQMDDGMAETAKGGGEKDGLLALHDHEIFFSNNNSSSNLLKGTVYVE